MAFNAKSLNLFSSSPYGTAGANINFYTCATADAAATVLAAGYFNPINSAGTQTNALQSNLKVNDVIIIMSVAGGTGDMLIVKVTASAPGADVTVAVNSEASGS